MKITKVRVSPVKKQTGTLVAFADIAFDDCFVVKSLRIIKGRNGLFVAMPSKKRDTGEWDDIAHPITGDFRKEINDAVLDEFHKSQGADGPEEVPPTPTRPEYDDDLPF